MLLLAIVLMAAAAVISTVYRKPRPWRADEVPVTFWAWRNQTPSEQDLFEAIEKARARAIFQRAGQIDYQNGKLVRIRPVSGQLPICVDLHLVYNATQTLLTNLENIDEKALAQAIAEALREDLNRAAQDNALAVGIQIDFDVPTRLLKKYERILRLLRAELKPGTKLSITGLPTWMQSRDLASTLNQVDFWVPQFYGADIPERLDQIIPISSTNSLESFVNSARKLDKPFYAGLAAYGYGLLYNPAGALITLRGDVDATVVATDPNLELIDKRSFEPAKLGSEWRYVYRARADGVTDKLAMHAGDVLVLDLPTAESLRTSARTVRELAGEKLLGICIFRLSAFDDPATLTTEQVAVALADQDSAPEFKIRLVSDEKRTHTWMLEVENRGSAGAIDLRVEVPMEPGTIESLKPERGVSLETTCLLRGADTNQPCSQNRANVIRMMAPGLRPGQTCRALLVLKTAPPNVVPVSIETQTDAGTPYLNRLEIPVESGAKR